MRKSSNTMHAALFLLMAMAMSGCDEGDILPKEYTSGMETYTAKLTARVTDMEHWTPSYSLNVAAFCEETDYSLTQKQLLPANIQEDGTLSIVLTNIPLSATRVELCVSNTLRQRVLTLASVKIAEGASVADTLQLQLDAPVSLSLYGAIQRGLFDGMAYNCASCHRDDAPRAGLSLARGSSFKQLVGAPSTRVDGSIRVVPGNATASVLHQALAEGNQAGLAFDHSNMVSSQVLKLLDEWINSGARE